MSEYNPDDDQGSNILVRELRIIQYIDEDGSLNTVDFSQGTNGAELDDDGYAILTDWAQAFALSSKVAAILADE
ncbi:hypothetical protein SEA_CHASER_102 [Mycobacterium phage Chaser]|nr:hypothetical protein SEA_CHASER_102 [Mycobacterium phage Chaser]